MMTCAFLEYTDTKKTKIFLTVKISKYWLAVEGGVGLQYAGVSSVTNGPGRIGYCSFTQRELREAYIEEMQQTHK
jgi:hypothetical protein